MGVELLLDTHALAWWWMDDSRLPAAARAAIAADDNRVLVSAASAWEIATKHRLGKWPEAGPLVAGFENLLRRSRFSALPIHVEHARLAGSLDGEHRDPFDRMLVAQSRIEAVPLVTSDPVFARYGVVTIWAGPSIG